MSKRTSFASVKSIGVGQDSIQGKSANSNFEPVKLDIKVAQTAVVCLQSTEDTVLIRACDSLFKFADKSDNNKLTLHQMGATDTLFTLTHHENPTVQRNATMAFGLLAAHVRRHLRKIDCIPHIVSLLSPEHDRLTNEFAIYWLCQMCTDYSTKSAVLSLNVLQPLIRLVDELDPDIKYYSLATIEKILDDYHARSVVRELNGIEPILNCLKSDYPQITEAACNCIQKLATDPLNRAVLRDNGGLDKMIDFIGQDDSKDVHVHCLNALANILEDTECLDLIQSNGGLKRLMQFVQDSVVPAVQASAAKAIGRAARKPQNRKIFAEQDAERAMVFLLLSDHDEVRIAACQALAVMAESMLSRETIRNNDGILTLVQMMQKENARLREFSTLAMSNLTQSNPNNCRELQDQNGIEVLIKLLSDEKDTTKAYACSTLANCSTDVVIRTDALNKGIISALLVPLKSSYEVTQAKAAIALSAFGIDKSAKNEILNKDGIIPQLISLLKSNNDEVRRNACFAISVLCTDVTIATEILRHGALEIIRGLNTSDSRKSKFTEMALQKILDSHLSAKYSYLGRLDVNNVTTDGFYDMGPIKEDGKFLTIDELSQQELNEKRAILVVYAREDNSVDSVAGRGKKEKREVEEKRGDGLAKSAADSQDNPGTYKPIIDKEFQMYVNEVRSQLSSLTLPEQISALARFVSDKMGGPINVEDISSFGYEVAMNQLKAEVRSNIIPIGKVKKGIHAQRAFLFKTLADRLNLQCALIRGNYNRAWNEVILADNTKGVRFPPKVWIVDLLHEPGRLILANSTDARLYTTLS
ncbi:unnamed protein product [Didymodactylos carnosus]|uniref:EDR1/CTR1/ARMC3-like peptidase-like domain-containing protein n=1 Tax=Didymodactylos carnosus TaxID=1234261 RepID=A0A815CB60_9BILA|nr:unnamed protein product [Didymodactylos carnosus]CAF4076581.1 unnamed protein product [Didymodactylos carnosus]